MGASRACRSLRTPPWGALRAYTLHKGVRCKGGSVIRNFNGVDGAVGGAAAQELQPLRRSLAERPAQVRGLTIVRVTCQAETRQKQAAKRSGNPIFCKKMA